MQPINDKILHTLQTSRFPTCLLCCLNKRQTRLQDLQSISTSSGFTVRAPPGILDDLWRNVMHRNTWIFLHNLWFSQWELRSTNPVPANWNSFEGLTAALHWRECFPSLTPWVQTEQHSCHSSSTKHGVNSWFDNAEAKKSPFTSILSFCCCRTVAVVKPQAEHHVSTWCFTTSADPGEWP